MPSLMREYPGLLPWHFGGEEALTFLEIHAIQDDFMAVMKARKKQADEARTRSRR
jgi:hypothetical protein